jgi:hypothetical protein
MKLSSLLKQYFLIKRIRQCTLFYVEIRPKHLTHQYFISNYSFNHSLVFTVLMYEYGEKYGGTLYLGYILGSNIREPS